MLAIQNLLKSVSCSIRNILKKSCRNCAVLVSGFSVFAMVSLHTNGFGGTGRNKAVVECSAMKGTEETQAEDDVPRQQEKGAEGTQAESAKPKQQEKGTEGTQAESAGAEQEEGAGQAGSEGCQQQGNKKEETEEHARDSEQKGTGQEGNNGKNQKKGGKQKKSKSPKQQGNGTDQEYLPENTFAVSCRTAAHTEQDKLKSAEKAQIEKHEMPAVCASVEPVQNEVQKPPANPYGGIAISEEDYDALLRIVQAEAGGEDEQGRILVAEVILNRVLADEFASTVHDVIFEKSGGSSQFAPTADGRYYSVEVTQSTIEAVEKAIHEEDLSQGALFFSARRKANPYDMAWFDNNLTWLFQYGGHEFYTLP